MNSIKGYYKSYYCSGTHEDLSKLPVKANGFRVYEENTYNVNDY